jgi:hypothetical protein
VPKVWTPQKQYKNRILCQGIIGHEKSINEMKWGPHTLGTFSPVFYFWTSTHFLDFYVSERRPPTWKGDDHRSSKGLRPRLFMHKTEGNKQNVLSLALSLLLSLLFVKQWPESPSARIVETDGLGVTLMNYIRPKFTDKSYLKRVRH